MQDDLMEMGVIERALKAGVPLLGICRGAQLLNMVLGGTLLADIRDLHREVPFRNSIRPVKWVRLEAQSRLASVIGLTETRVNSLHHQAVERCGEHLQIAARDHNAIVQAIETVRDKFIVGVQWHPEYLPYRREQRALFAAFVAAARDSQREMPP